MRIGELYSLEFSQYSLEKGGQPFHICPIKQALKANVEDFFNNNRKEDKWQILFIGSLEECENALVEFMEAIPLIKQKNAIKGRKP